MATLTAYLSTLNNCDTQQGIYVDPENPNENYSIGSSDWETDLVYAGSFDRLSFGFVPSQEAFCATFCEGNDYPKDRISEVEIDGKTIKINQQGLWNAYQESHHPKAESFWTAIQELMDEQAKEIAEFNAEDFVADKLLDIIAQAKEESLTY